MVYELAIVEDRGTHYLATGVTKSSFDGLASRHDKTLKLSYGAYQKIGDALKINKVVTISKDLTSDEVLPGEVTVSDNKVDDFGLYKKVAMQKIHKKQSYFMTALSSLDILSFTVTNNKLCSEGFFITNENREEKYIEIIEKDDEKLIEALERYLVLLDNVTKTLDFDDMCHNYLKEIEKAKDEKSVDEIVSNFYTHYDKLSN